MAMNPKIRILECSRKMKEEAKSPWFIEYCRKIEEEESKRRNCRYWSKLPPDLIHSVLDRLSFRDLKQAKSVCSSWHSASSNCVPKNQIPWLVQFPPHDNNNDNNRCKLFNSEETDKIYTSRDMCVGFSETVCVATYGFWLLMRTPLFNFYIVNLLTGERIDLPAVESQIGKTKLERIVDDKFHATTQFIGSEYIVQGDSIGLEINSPRLWIDDESKDYMVMLCFRIFKWSYRSRYAIICKKGDHCWRQIPNCYPCRDLVYKDQKFYVYGTGNGCGIKILDVSGELAPESDLYVEPFFLDMFALISPSGETTIVKKTNIVVTVSGDVLMVASLMSNCKNWRFKIYKVRSKWNKKWERVSCLGDEAMLLDLGITVPAKDIQGIKRNSIYFSGGFGEDENDIIIFDLGTRKIERPYQSVCSSMQYSRARWFFPSFNRKYSS